MGAVSKKLKVGDCIRLTKHVMPAFKSARAAAYRELASIRKTVGMGDFDPNAPKYIFLNVASIKGGYFVANDLITFKVRAFRELVEGKFEESDPSNPNNILDFWEWEDMQILSPQEIIKLLENRQNQLERKAELAQSNADLFRQNSAALLALLKKALPV